MIYYKHKESGTVIRHEKLKQLLESQHEKIAFARYNYIRENIEPVRDYWSYQIHEIPFTDDFETFNIEYDLSQYLKIIESLRLYESMYNERNSYLIKSNMIKLDFVTYEISNFTI